MDKIQKAEKLVKESQAEEDSLDIGKAIQEYNRLCLSSSLDAKIRIQALSSFVKNVPDEGNDMLIRLQDSLKFIQGEELDATVDILVGVTKSTAFNSHQRVSTAVCLYNNGFFNVCHSCFDELCRDESILVEYRIEATRYLFGTEISDHISTAQDILSEIINTQIYPSQYRYKVIAGFISKSGVSTLLNFTKIKVPYNEEFVYHLQKTFFFNIDNGIRERILSGQHLLQMKVTDDKVRTEVSTELMKIMDDSSLDENIRADVADVILREGSKEERKKARDVIVDLGFSPTDKPKTLAEKERTLYSNSQNIHNVAISESVDRFIENIINDDLDIKIRPFDEVHRDVCELVRQSTLSNEDTLKAYKALNRISIDSATFTRYKVSLSEIFVHVWLRVKRYSSGSSERKNLEQRMLEELVDMADTCSSGHSGRLINVLSIYDDTLRISWDDQIKSNIIGRLMARIRSIDNDELQAQISLGMLKDADEEDKEAYRSFIDETLKELRIELEKEFVGEGYVSKEDFDVAFKKGSKDL